jgi:capsular exopolysaccharide synthesis family protein
MAALEIRLANVEVEKQVIEVQLEAAQQALLAQDKVAVSSQVLDQIVANDPEILAMNKELLDIRTQIREYERTSKNPADLDPVKALLKRRAELGNSLTKSKQELRKSRTGELQESELAAKRDEINGYIEELKKQQMLEELLRKRLDAERGELEKYGDQALNLEFARAEMERAEEVFDRITDRMTALQTEKAADKRVHLFGDATVPIEPVTTQTKFVAMVGGAMFLLPFALALLWEVRVRRVATVDQLREESWLPVIGEITALPTRSLMPGRRAQARFERQRSTFEESISHLRTSLVLCDDTAHLHVVAVASAVSREGKTSVAAQLAANMAKASSEPTLLVDADLRAPDIHEVMGVNAGPGLADVLSRKATLQSVIVPTSLPNVWVLPAGHSTISPHTLFTIDAYRDVLETLRAQFHYIVIDCPPLLSASEALTVAKSADGVLLCTMRDVSRVGQVREARDRLTRAGARPLGVVLSGVSPKSYTARYGGYGYAIVHPGDSFDGEAS